MSLAPATTRSALLRKSGLCIAAATIALGNSANAICPDDGGQVTAKVTIESCVPAYLPHEPWSETPPATERRDGHASLMLNIVVEEIDSLRQVSTGTLYSNTWRPGQKMQVIAHRYRGPGLTCDANLPKTAWVRATYPLCCDTLPMPGACFVRSVPLIQFLPDKPRAPQITVARDVRLTAEPNATASVVGELKQGAAVEIIGKKGPYVQVKSGSTQGWTFNVNVRYGP